MRGGAILELLDFTPPPELPAVETINGFMNMENVKTTKQPGLGLCRYVKKAKTTANDSDDNSAGAPRRSCQMQTAVLFCRGEKLLLAE